MSLVTIECARPGARYTLFESGPCVIHLAGPGANGGTGPCICGFDRTEVGFSVGGGTTDPGVLHEVCAECARLAGDQPIRGLRAALFTGASA